MEYRVTAGRPAFVAATALALFLTGAPDVVSGERRITTEEEYRRIAVDREQKADWGHVINRKDGSVRGFFKGKFVSREWSWEGTTIHSGTR